MNGTSVSGWGDGPLLLLEGGLSPAGVALIERGRVVSSTEFPPIRVARRDLFRAAAELLTAHRWTASDLAAVAVGSGPGSFTGLRVALGVALGLRTGRENTLPIFAADSFAILTKAARITEREPHVVVAIPWGRLRVMLLRDETAARRAELVARDELAARTDLIGRTLVLPRASEGESEPLNWPNEVAPVVTEVSPIDALAELVIAEEIAPAFSGALFADYLVPPDAVRPFGDEPIPDRYELRNLGESDLDQLEQLEAAAVRSPWSREMLRPELHETKDRLAIGGWTESGELVAAGIARIELDVLAIHRLAVKSIARRSGLGRSVLRALISRGREAGAQRADVEVERGNAPAIALYSAEGFVVVGRRQGYYRDDSDALLLSLALAR